MTTESELPLRDIVADKASDPTQKLYDTMGSAVNEIPEIDVLLVGAGFASFTLMHRLRKLNLRCLIYEKGAASGGIWHWNCYPGARVDSDTPVSSLAYSHQSGRSNCFCRST